MTRSTAACRNCGEAVSSAFCPACGQAADDRRRPILALAGDFFSEFLSLDGKHLRTAAQLLRPGRLTVLYRVGKRASYVPPVRVYLVSSLLFFLLVGFPAPDASRYNVYVDEVLVGRDEPDPSLGRLQLSFDGTGWLSRPIEPLLEEKREELRAMPPQELLDGFLGGLERTVPTTLIFFVPILAFGVALLYLRQPFYFVDHLVFAFHFQSALFVLLVFAHLANRLGVARLVPAPASYVAVIVVAAPFYLLFALKRVYGQSWPKTLLKTAALGFLYSLLIQPVMAVTLALVLSQM